MTTIQSGSSPFDAIPFRSMRVKVLYSFDNENKTNCLARLPDVTSVRAIPVDESTHIGIIELDTCVRAIVSASPELVSSLNKADFTIYAHDYSENDSPLVGQGMLSSVLAASSPALNVPGNQSRAMITGRICKNVLGLFSNGVSETLEVKLRLVPVPKPAQYAHVKSMESHRPCHQRSMSSGIDFHAWSDAIHAASPVPTPMPEEYEDASEVCQPGHGPSMDHRRMSDTAYVSRQPSRSARGLQRSNTRPSSRASVRSDHSTRPHLMPSVSESSVMRSRPTEGPSRKRAKVTQTEWRGKSVIGPAEDSLRVAASTAASIRIHKPVATRPTQPGNRSLEPPPRAPTPVAFKNSNQQYLRNYSSQPSYMRRESTLCNITRSESPLPGDQSDALASSPGGTTGMESATGSPIDFPSSPPAMPEPSSPSLPALLKVADSGFMSGSAYDAITDIGGRAAVNEEIQTLPPRHVPRQQARQTQAPTLYSELSFVEQTPGPVELLPTKMSTQPDKSRQKAQNSITHSRRQSEAQQERPFMPQASSAESVASRKPSATAKTSTTADETASTVPSASRTTSSGVPIASVEIAGPVRAPTPAPATTAQLKQACSLNSSQAITRAASPAGVNRSGSGAKRKKIIQDKLIQSVASGVMPMYCGNCGAIETSTWRSLHFKIIEGSPDDLGAGEKDAETTGIEIMEQDVAFDRVTKFRLIKSMRKCKDVQMQGYETMSVCNPCGLWFNKFKCMRPAHKWNVSKKKSTKKAKQEVHQSDTVEPHSDFPQPDAQVALVEQAAPDSQAVTQPSHSRADTGRPAADRPRASSAQPHSSTAVGKQWDGKDLNAALVRAIQSSPLRIHGSQESPIELADDLTPKPTCRLLFPSPRKDRQPLSLDETSPSKLSSKFSGKNIESVLAPGVTGDKENMDPEHRDVDMDLLFGGSPSLLQNIFKTPSKVTSSVHRTPPSKSLAFFDAFPLNTPSPLRRQTGSSGKMLMNSKATPVSTASFDPFLPTFSSAERDALFPRTPTRQAGQTCMSPSRKGADDDQVMTPFTKHLTQLLNRTDTTGSSDFVLDMGSNADTLVGLTGGLEFSNMAGLSSPGKAFDMDELSGFVSPSAFFTKRDGRGEGDDAIAVLGKQAATATATVTVSGLGLETTTT